MTERFKFTASVLTLGFVTLALELIAQVFNTGYCPSALSATRYRDPFWV